MKTPVIIINFKTYKEATGENALRLARICGDVAREKRAEIAVAPQLADAQRIANAVKIPVLAQHVDNIDAGSNTGWVLPESIMGVGLVGSLINHSEHRLRLDVIEDTIQRLRKLRLISVVCSNNVATTTAVAALKPDFVAIEPPELIGTGVAVSEAKPEVVRDAVEAVRRIDNKVGILCGAGITKGPDVKKAIELGTQGVLLASGVVKAQDPKRVLSEMASYMLRP